MNRSKRICSAALLLALLATAAPAQPAEGLLYHQIVQKPDATYWHTPLGLCEDYPEETTTTEIIRGDMEVLKRTGIDLLRISFGWDGIEGERDRYDWLFWDEYVETAVDEYGITLIPYICYTPLWNATNKNPDVAWHSPPEDYEEFGAFVFDLVTRYKDRIKTWEIWNEPDIWIYWTGTQEEFARLLKAGAEAVRRADPEATVVMGGLAHDTEWLRGLFRDHDVSRYVDVVNMHNYFETWHRYPLENIGQYVHAVRDIVDRYGDGQPLWMAEVGYSTQRNAGAVVSDAYTAYYAYEHTPAYQAVHLVRTLASVLATGQLSAVAWYEVKDLPPADAVIGDNNNRHLGVAYADYRPKPAEHALAFMNRLFSEKMRGIDSLVTSTRPLDSPVQMHVFEQEDGDVIVVAWLQTRVLGAQDDIAAGQQPDPRRATVDVILPRSLAGEATRYDALGNAEPFEAVRRAGTETTATLTLDGGTVSILHLAKDIP